MDGCLRERVQREWRAAVHGRVLLAVIAAALAAYLFSLGFGTFSDGTKAASLLPPSGSSLGPGGTVSVVSNAPGAEAEAVIALQGGEPGSGEISFVLAVEPAAADTVVAVVLEGAVVPAPYDDETVSGGRALDETVIHGADDEYLLDATVIQGGDKRTLIREAGYTGRADRVPDDEVAASNVPTTTVATAEGANETEEDRGNLIDEILGTRVRAEGSETAVAIWHINDPIAKGAVEVSIDIDPPQSSLVRPGADGYDFYLPEIVPGHSGREVLSAPEGNRERQTLIETEWHPVNLTGRLELAGLRPNQRIDAIPAPDSTDSDSAAWSGTLPVSARGTVPSTEARLESQAGQFRAGIWVGLAAGLIVLIMELLFEAYLAFADKRVGRRQAATLLHKT